MMVSSSRIAALLSAVSIATALAGASVREPRATDVPLASLDLSKMRVQPAGGRAGQAATTAQANKSIDGNPLRIGGRDFAEGVGTRATSVLLFDLGGRAELFTAMVGADDNPLPPPAGRGASPTPAPAAPPIP